MSRVLVPLAPGFEEIEAVTVIDILRRAGVEVVVAGTRDEPIEASRGVRIVADTTLDAVASDPFDMVVLPGGADGTEHLKQNPVLREILDRCRNERRKLAAICAAPTVLHAFGLTNGARLTCHPAVAETVTDAELTDERVVVDGDLVTSRAAGTAMEFAFRLVEILEGPDKRDEVNEGVLARL